MNQKTLPRIHPRSIFLRPFSTYGAYLSHKETILVRPNLTVEDQAFTYLKLLVYWSLEKLGIKIPDEDGFSEQLAEDLLCELKPVIYTLI